MDKLTTQKINTNSELLKAYSKVSEFDDRIIKLLNEDNRQHWNNMLASSSWRIGVISTYSVWVLYVISEEDLDNEQYYYHALSDELENFNVPYKNPYHGIVNNLINWGYKLYVFPELDKKRVILLGQ